MLAAPQDSAEHRPTTQSVSEMDALLCSLHRVAAALHEGAEATRRETSAKGARVIDFSKFDARASCLVSLRHLHAELGRLTAAVVQYGRAAEALHQDEVAYMQECVDSANRPIAAPVAQLSGKHLPAASPWKIETRAGASSPPARDLTGGAVPELRLAARPTTRPTTNPAARPTANPAAHPTTNPAVRPTANPTARPAANPAARPATHPTARPATHPPARPATHLTARRYHKIALADGVSLDAVVLADPKPTPREILAAVSTPELYYIPAWNHFAVRCGGVVFHGNIGSVFPAGTKNPQRVKECRRGGECPSLQPGKAPCNYYHDPAECPGSREVRSFTAAARGRFGSRETLRSELLLISPGDARQHVAQTAHDILCSMVLAKYVAGLAG